LVNKERALGSKKWTDRMLTERLMMVYSLMNYNVVALIRQDPAYKKIISNDVHERIMNHEINIQEVNNIKNLYKRISSSKK
jgi:predicted regulator of amino acid metabolism with ACT domain